MRREYDIRISVTKAICIILMVVGHSRCPEQLDDFIYLFHMPCFFFISGFLFKEKYLTDMWTFVKRRLKGLWWPFVKWSIIFLLLHNIFYYCYFYQNLYSWKDVVYKLFKILTLTGSEQLLGGYWFLKELLYASIMSLVAMKIVRVAIREKISDIKIGIILSLIFLIIAYFLSIIPFKIPTINSLTMLAAACYLAGYTFCKFPGNYNSSLIKCITCFVVVLAISFVFRGSMYITGWRIIIYFIISMIGTLGIINFSGLIKGKVMNILNYIGSKTLYILTFHFLSFKLVSYIKIEQFGLSITKLSDFPVIPEHNTYYWIIYSIIGTILPLLIWEIIKQIEKFIFNIKRNKEIDRNYT